MDGSGQDSSERTVRLYVFDDRTGLELPAVCTLGPNGIHCKSGGAEHWLSVFPSDFPMSRVIASLCDSAVAWRSLRAGIGSHVPGLR